jgi:hypothetical protein
MPNNKKQRKNKEKKTAAIAAAAAAAGPSFNASTTARATATAPSRRPINMFRNCDHNPSACDKCFFAFPPGCLHTLREDERNSREIYKMMYLFEECVKGDLDLTKRASILLRQDERYSPEVYCEMTNRWDECVKSDLADIKKLVSGTDRRMLTM